MKARENRSTSSHKVVLRLMLMFSILSFPRLGLGQVQPQQLWASTAPGTAAVPKVMALDPSGNIIVAGNDAGDFLTAKFDSSGNLLWSARQNGRVGTWDLGAGVTSIAFDQAGNVYVTGGLGGNRAYTTTFCFFDCITYHFNAADQVTIKYSSNGQRQWMASYSERGDRSFNGTGLAVDGAGNVYVTGTVTIKYDAVGKELWLKTNVPANTLLLDNSTNLCLTGPSSGTRKLDRNGNQLWLVPVYGGVLKADAAGNLYVSPIAYAGPTTKLDSAGVRLWSAAFGGQTAFGNTGSLLLASTMVNNSYPDFSTVKLDQNGSLVWQAINNQTGGNDEAVSTLAADSTGNVYVAGRVNGTSTLLRYSSDGIRLWQMQAATGPLLALDAANNIYVAGGSNGFLLVKYAQNPVPGAPVIAPPPFHPLVRPGEDVTLGVNVTGTGPLSYLWRRGEKPVADATNSTLSLTNVQTNQGLYSIEVTNGLGSAAAPVYLSVLSPLASQTVVLGATAVFRVPLSGGPAAFQWRFNGAPLAGQTRAVLALTNVGPSHVGDYSVVVSNYYGNVLTSSVAQLNLNTRVTEVWARTLPDSNVGDTAQANGVDGAGNVFVAGYAACGYKLVKYNPAGQQLWETCGPYVGRLAGLAVDPSGSVCVAGGPYVSKFAPTGTLLWNSQFNDGAGSSNNVATGIDKDGTGNFYVTGYIAATNGFGIFTAKYDPNGERLWGSFRLGTSDDFAQEVVVDEAGNAYVCGAVWGSAGAYNFIVIKYDANGNQVWARTYDGPVGAYDIAAHIDVDLAGSVYVTGWSPGDDHITDFATIKYDANGTLLWAARYNGPGSGEDNPHGLAVDAAGNVYVTGSSVGADFKYDIATIKYAPDGTELWLRRYSGPADANDYNRALGLDGLGNVYVQGHSDSVPGIVPSTEVVTLSYDQAGNLRWAARCETGIESGPYYRNGSMVLDSAATVYVADTTFLTGTPAFLMLKYVQRTPVPARLAVPTILPGGELSCGLTGEAGLRYSIEASGDLMNWGSLTSVVVNAAGTGEFFDTTQSGSHRRFYRAVQP